MNKKTLLVTFFTALVLSTLAPAAWAFEAEFGWLPPNLNPEYGGEVDQLYYHIMILVGIIFFLTEGMLLLSIVLFRARPGRRASYSHGNTKAEILWSIVPAIILVWLALHQKSTWWKAKMQFPDAKTHPDLVEVQAFPEQFQWNFRYPGPDGQFATADDFVTVNELHVPVNRLVLIRMTGKDVIHSLFVPFARVKQDAVPGMLTKAWFKIDRIPCWDLKDQKLKLLTEEEFRKARVALSGFAFSGEPVDSKGNPVAKGQLWPGMKKYSYSPTKSKRFKVIDQGTMAEVAREDAGDLGLKLHVLEIACAELCGLGHYKMRAEMTVETAEMYEAWLRSKADEKAQYGPGKEERERFQAIWDKFHPDYNRK
ncbi:MAG: cytochrome c oxidase subunit II [Planctomycetes bacterium]|nr:cytochrome c oxidase subunit II [Planctomycetota bacterium]